MVPGSVRLTNTWILGFCLPVSMELSQIGAKGQISHLDPVFIENVDILVHHGFLCDFLLLKILL